ncbi:(d)CMP kinase [Saccharibacter sp. 17.LH.SD]|uniref:(d)CMP kinase n=1 Tax=Saccharibacter sp. 17.LH.SD TaxID=2689393 RepID=UPI0013715868|nr:(d)CMP kinase [Saccharibacter sp. 17.LH.SD]MXV43730.1 (d)CMP kinase [Saccharibacter sp. 17.LH.SD]
MSGTRRLIVAVDGPAAAGKGTLARALAETLGLPYLDTGLLYRAVARRVLDQGKNPAECGAEQARVLQTEDLQRDDLRASEVDRAASLVARQPSVRAALLERQREFGQAHGAVVDGRDIGTVVFPNADVKLFITASPEVRAQRRYKQRHGVLCDDPALLAEEVAALVARDEQDASRAVSPLRPADNAIQILTDDLGAEAVLHRALDVLRDRGLYSHS